jgi:glycolate oxidase FAD binding subunit
VTDRLLPQTNKDVLDIIRAAAEDKQTLEIIGAGSKVDWGRPVNSSAFLDLTKLTGIMLYEPAELVLSAAAGTSMMEIQQALAAENQQLAFEPPDFSSLYGGNNSGTLGGTIAANLSGSKRLQAGAARDHFLGFEAVSGRGEEFKSGGRVVKNVTGFDLSKLLAGSFGTLAAMTSVTVKVLPKPDKTRTVLLYGLDDEAAVKALSETLQGPFEINSAAHLPANIAAKSAVSYIASSGGSVAAVRVQGPEPSVEVRCRAVRALWQAHGEVEELHGHNSENLWQEVRDIAKLLSNPEDQIWRLSVPPSTGAGVVAAITGQLEGEYYYDWGGGLIWLALEAKAENSTAILRQVIDNSGGHATLVRGSAELRSSIDVFHPQPEELARLSSKIKSSFDPAGVLNPGKMYKVDG